jgi:acyl dehydratase
MGMERETTKDQKFFAELFFKKATTYFSFMNLFIDDLTPGMTFTSATHTLDEGRMKSFAAEFDPQPFHLDNEAAKASIFGGLAASGWHTAAATMRLLVDSLPFPEGIVGTGGEIAWTKPVRPGDMLQVTTEVTEVTPSRSKPDRGMVTLRSETRNQHGETVQVFTCKVVLRRRPV